MHIAIDTTPLSDANSVRGVGSYTRNLIESLQKYGSQHSYSFFTRGQKVPDHSDLVHYPYFDPFFLTLPLRKMRPTVVTVHDLIPLVFPDKFSRGTRGEIKWHLQKLSFLGVKRIITDSLWSKADIHRIIMFPNDRIDVIPLAPAPVFRKAIDTQKLETIRGKYSLPDTFVLYVGDVNWNKNIAGLVAALGNLARKDVKLVLVGNAHEDMRMTGQVLGFVPEQDLAGIYRLATVYVQPSFYEGFGLPVLEAFVSGCPVVSSTAGSLKEIIGPAIPVDPNDPKSIASGIAKVLAMNKKEKDDLIARQQTWSRQFSWEKAAKATVTAYEKVLA